MIINTIEHQEIAPLHKGTGNDLWIPGTILRSHPGKRFCSRTQDESEEVELVPEVEFDQAVSLGHYGAVYKK